MRVLGLITALGLAFLNGSLAARCGTNVNLTGKNPFLGRKVHSHKRWREEVLAAADAIGNADLKTKALKVADVGTFLWVDSIRRIADLAEALEETSCDEVLGVVLHNLPGAGPQASGSIDDYKASFISAIRATLAANQDVAVAIIMEPSILASIRSFGPGGIRCPRCGIGLKDGVTYASQQLALPNIAIYLDAANGMVLGSADRLPIYGALLSQVFEGAGSPPQVRGFSVNVANYNAWKKSPGEFEPADDFKYNPAQDEWRFVHLMNSSLSDAGVSNQWHAIVDTSRNAVQGLRSNWTSTCNVVGAGFGVRPTTETDDDLTDAFVWVKNGGESDGTSDENSDDYSSLCGLKEAYKPSPGYGQWNQPYFEMLLENAVPSF